jgi:hypothetical protein
MAVYRATSTHGQVLHDSSLAGLGQRTMRAGDQFTLWAVHELGAGRPAGPRYAGYQTGGQLTEPDKEAG